MLSYLPIAVIVVVVFALIIVVAAKVIERNNDDAKSKLTQEKLDEISNTPYEPCAEENFVCAIGGVVDIQPDKNKVKLKIMYFNYPYHEFLTNKITISAEEFSQKQIQCGNMVRLLVKIDKDNFTKIKGIL